MTSSATSASRCMVEEKKSRIGVEASRRTLERCSIRGREASEGWAVIDDERAGGLRRVTRVRDRRGESFGRVGGGPAAKVPGGFGRVAVGRGRRRRAVVIARRGPLVPWEGASEGGWGSPTKGVRASEGGRPPGYDVCGGFGRPSAAGYRSRGSSYEPVHGEPALGHGDVPAACWRPPLTRCAPPCPLPAARTGTAAPALRARAAADPRPTASAGTHTSA